METALRVYVKPSPTDFTKLAPGKYFSDGNVLLYLWLIDRQSVLDSTLPKVWTVDSFFVLALLKRGYAGVR